MSCEEADAMNERSKVILELAKYPILILSIVIGLAASKSLLGLEFGMITEVSAGGVKFAEKSEAQFQALTTLESKLNQALIEIEELRKAAPTAAVRSDKVQAEIFEAAQTVSDQTAKIQAIQVTTNAREKQLRGYMWIGNFRQSWAQPQLAALDSRQPVKLTPEELTPGTEYIVLGNVVVRDGLPANDRQYYKGRNVLGVVPRGARVRLASAPQRIDREYAVQYWAEVEVLAQGG
jgi:hypothetical protein